MTKFSWQITHQSKKNKARTGILTTPHGKINTPAFIFCATKAALKSFTTTEAKKIGTQIILSNTYHLMLRPGVDRISSIGGLHEYMNCKIPILTDSGGFEWSRQLWVCDRIWVFGMIASALGIRSDMFLIFGISQNQYLDP